jgi:SAM-dependent methyltransferase
MKETDIRPEALFQRYLSMVEAEAKVLAEHRESFVLAACPACGAAPGAPALEKFGFTFRECPDCGSLYTSPRPSAAQIAAYYRDAESVKFWSTHFFRETAEARRERMFRPRAALVAELCGRDGRPRGRLVDIGSGYGLFLEEVVKQEAVKEVLGIEPAPNLAAVCRGKGFTVVEKRVEDLAEGEIQADVATAFEVLEHVFDPPAFLRGARRTLCPGGMLLLTTQTVTGFDIQVLWEHSKSVAPPQHINLLSVDGLRRLVERCGFSVTEVTTPGNLDVDIVQNGMKVASPPDIPRFVRTLLRQPESVRQAFQVFLREHGLSSHVRVIAKRQEDES